ncbi:hypothetical protein [uncultured Maricaulis sp.]|uniref:hypothetical protein n=1 Tax=uncultured Maricaulis sp. TaxID=174710 RepID=UPI0030DD2E39
MAVLARRPGRAQLLTREPRSAVSGQRPRQVGLHPALAWLTGCAAAALTGYWAIGLVSLAGGETAPARFLVTMAAALPGALAYAALVAFLTAIPMPLLVLTERAAQWRRGASDFMTAALMGALFAQLFGWPMLDGPRGIAITAFAAFSGGVGGLAYWLAAGRPGLRNRRQQQIVQNHAFD